MSDQRAEERTCKRCGRGIEPDAPTWKCCPVHTTEQGPDVMCEPCANEFHPEWLDLGKTEIAAAEIVAGEWP